MSQSPEGSIYMELQKNSRNKAAIKVAVARRLYLYGIYHSFHLCGIILSQSPEGSIYMECVDGMCDQDTTITSQSPEGSIYMEFI